MDRQEAIKDMMRSMASGNANEVKTKFDSIMAGRTTAAVDDFKAELSQSVFKNPDLQAMGLADGEDHIHEVDPSAEPENVE